MKLLVLMCSTLLATTSFAMRCSNSIVLEGDTPRTVIDKCGSPDQSYGDIFGDRGTLTYKMPDGAIYTVEILNNRVVNIQEDRL